MIGRALAAFALAAALSLTWTSIDGSRAQQPPAPPFKVTPLSKAPLTTDPSKEVVMIKIEWPANAPTPWHTHPGDEYATVIEGSLITQVEGQEPRTIAAGQSYHQPAGVVHMAKTSNTPATTINVFVVERDKPLMLPQPGK